MSKMKNVEQQRAKLAWKAAQNNKPEFKTAVDKIPTYIKTNGLLNTLAFMYDKGKEWETLAGVICTQLTTEGFVEKCSGSKDLIDYLLKEERTSRDILQITAETLALFNWLRRFAKS